MTFSRINLTTIAALSLGALGTTVVLAHSAGLPSLISGYGLWAVSPYAIFAIACFLARNRARSILTLVVAGIADVFALLVYRDVLFVHSGSMSGLVFLFVPFYQLAAAILLLIVLVVLYFSRPRSRNPKA